jgi:hypothetical protein
MSFQALKKLAHLALVAALFAGCSDYDGGGGEKVYRLSYNIGFASDTTAILFYSCMDHIEIRENSFSSHCCGASMKLVDVRFNKVYWESKIDSRGCHGGKQWNDSTVSLGEDLLWTIGNSEPKKVDFNWGTSEDYSWRPWKNDSILGVAYYKYLPDKYIIIDTKTNTVNDWAKTGEYEWTKNCNDIYWGKNGGICLTGNQLYSRSLIEVSENQEDQWKWGAKKAMFKYDDDGNLAQEPLFWKEIKYHEKDGTFGNYIVEFTDQLGNVTEY